ncbi:hypothetical protein DUI87_16343 [Hirundo rustica rustica]|uniref:Uncharacterized protein n=1 Tax=Hirundo rustica rustica TaxID=333673 RepID=A0A3M0K152_HIRRU|nr:hypothetical protein DUI87_16343 [Hirundo rustica rustica]
MVGSRCGVEMLISDGDDLDIDLRKAKENSDLSDTWKRKPDSSYVFLWLPLKKFTGETMSLGLAFNAQKTVT